MANKEIIILNDLPKEPTESYLDTVKDILEKASEIYYNSGEDTGLTDIQFDDLFNWYTQYRVYNVGVDVDDNHVATKKVVGIAHEFPELVGTTIKAKSLDDFSEKSVPSFHLDPSRKYTIGISEKYDGNSVVVGINPDGKLVSAVTRGADGNGASVLPYLDGRTVKFPNDIDFMLGNNSIVYIKCEMILLKSDLDIINSDEYDVSYKNARSAVAGITSDLKHPELGKFLKLVPISIRVSNPETDGVENRNQELGLIHDIVYNESNSDTMGFVPFNIFTFVGITPDKFLDKLASVYFAYSDEPDKDQYNLTELSNTVNRGDLDYLIDGLVFEILDEDVRETLGRTDDHNNFDVAVKFRPNVLITHVEDVRWDISKTGSNRITPVIQYEPVVTSLNSTLTYSSVANIDRFNKLDLSKGDTIQIEYRNDVMGYISDNVIHDGKGDKLTLPESLDGTPVKYSKSDSEYYAYLDEDFETGKYFTIGRTYNFISKIGVKNIAWKMLLDLYNNGLLKEPEDVFHITVDQLMKLDGWKEKSSENFVSAMKDIREKPVDDYIFYGSLGVNGVGRTKFRAIFLEHDEHDLFDNPESLKDVDGIGDATVKEISTFLNVLHGMVGSLRMLFDLNPTKIDRDNIVLDEEVVNKISGKTIAFTGVRASAVDGLEDYLIQYNAKATASGVTKKTGYLVVGSLDHKTVKMQKAEDMNIPVVTMEQFLEEIKFN